MTWTIYHNPRCSKSRETLALLEAKGIQPLVIEYLKTPLSLKQLKVLNAQLGCTARDMLCRKEAEYELMALSNPKLSDTAILKAIIEAPKLLERPIVVHGNKAVFGRPPEQVLTLL